MCFTNFGNYSEQGYRTIIGRVMYTSTLGNRRHGGFPTVGKNATLNAHVKEGSHKWSNRDCSVLEHYA